MAQTESSQASMIDASAVEAALRKARSEFDAARTLWHSLLDELNCDEQSLISALRHWHGVEILEDAQLHQAKGQAVQGMAQRACLWVTSDGDKILLCEDPWAEEVARAVMRLGDPTIQLALLRPGQLDDLSPVHESRAPIHSSNESGRSNVTVDFVDAAIIRAYELGASDVHFETHRQGLRVKFRLDGVMVSGEDSPDAHRSEEIISRIKVMAQLDITERRRPQDGRIRWERANHESIDLRVSIMPSISGEDAVLRLLDKAQLRHSHDAMTLELLGFDHSVARKIRELTARPHGMLLITGPTGSGKTTTIYAALSEVNNELEKIITIEDPVEYELPGVLQIPVNEQKGLTFATGLRSILRHDPDKILVGEIRDSETAEIAVQSSLTGHLVMTTVHANSLFDVLGRFRHFDIDPFAFASALNGVVVQRLLRRVCSRCRAFTQEQPDAVDRLQKHALAVPQRWVVATGCPHCRQTGYRGRFVVAEVHAFDDDVRDLVVRQASMSELKAVLHADPSSRLLQRALDKIAEGQTTLEEVIRVVGLA